uniref:FXYD domain-containing ion transport regulator n=1 Tax=Oncorhynchus kisutch TaxID=8019 RepID=A0A8C7HH20_ONCKI
VFVQLTLLSRSFLFFLSYSTPQKCASSHFLSADLKTCIGAQEKLSRQRQYIHTAVMSTEGSILHDQSDFEYDYETLRTTGVIIGVILFVSGILIALSKKLTCSKSSSK